FALAPSNRTPAKVGPPPSPVIAQGNWNQNLALTGDLPDQITSIVPDQGTQQTFCSGAKPRNGDTWSDSFYASLNSSGAEWQLNIVIENFRGQGSYLDKDVTISLQSSYD